MFCKYCGKEIADDSVYCSSCGKQISGDMAAVPPKKDLPDPAPVQQKSEVRKCPKCGETVNQYAQVCRVCGASISADHMVDSHVNSTNRRKSRPFGCLIWAIIIMVVLGSCSALLVGGDGESASSKSPEPTSAKLSVSPTEAIQAPFESSPVVLPLDIVASTAESILKAEFDNCTISYDDTGFTATITVDGISLLANSAISGNKESLAPWQNIVSSSVTISESMTKYFRECGYTDFRVSIIVLNDLNSDDVLIMTIDGFLAYDAVADK